MVPGAAPARVPREVKPFTGELVTLRQSDEAFFLEHWRITAQELERAGVRYAPERDAYCYPVRDPRGYQVAALLRYYNGSKPKAVIYPENAYQPLQAWYRSAMVTDGRVCIVEDQLSAIKAARYCEWAVALMGTSISTDGAVQIARVRPTEVLVALDYDATDSAFRQQRLYSLVWPRSRVLPLRKDIKDMGRTALQELFV